MGNVNLIRVRPHSSDASVVVVSDTSLPFALRRAIAFLLTLSQRLVMRESRSVLLSLERARAKDVGVEKVKDVVEVVAPYLDALM